MAHKIPSFIRRQGRLTAGQQKALEEHWHSYCLDPNSNHDFEQVFGRKAALIVEIGFGNGASLAEMAAANPELDYIGIEVHKPGIGHLILQLRHRKLTNVRIFYDDAIEILEQHIVDNSLAGIHLFFPDPWPKKRHHKRRIVRPEYVALFAKKLQCGGYFHAATDWENYAVETLSVLVGCDALTNVCTQSDYCERPDYRPLTKFEKRGIRLGHGVWDLIFKKIGISDLV